MQNSIEDMNAKISEKENDIKERDQQMRERLIEMQAYTGTITISISLWDHQVLLIFCVARKSLVN